MPDKRRHRGQHPEDSRLFDPSQHERLRTGVGEFSWLLTRGYAPDSALKLVGDRYGLTARQRMAVRRSSCSDPSREQRRAKQVAAAQARGQTVAVDGYNVLITIESALSGALIFIGRDGCCRDIASIHGTYRKIEETVPAIELILDSLWKLGPRHVDWYLDRPVSNSGRLKALIADVLEARASTGQDDTPRDRASGDPRVEALASGDRPPTRLPAHTSWNIELVDSPDSVLAAHPGLVASSDSVVLDRCSQWLNLAAHIVDTRIPSAWKIDLRPVVDAT
jgi:hypothetical protein